MAKNKVSVSTAGINDLLKNIEDEFGEKKMKTISKKVINESAPEVKEQLKKDMSVYKDTGASIDEVVLSNATYKNGVTTAQIGWNGPEGRYRIIHLNEWGYTKKGKQITPRGFGVIEKSFRGSTKDYLENVESELKKYL